MRGLTEDQKLFVRDNYHTIGRAEMARELGISYDKVSYFCKKESLDVVVEVKKCEEGCNCYKHSEERRVKIAGQVRERWKDKEYRKSTGENISQARLGWNGKSPAIGFSIDLDGYKVLTGVKHPLSQRGRLGEHRMVLYDKIGPGPHKCHWCGKELEWGGILGIVADHLNEDRSDNRPENLAPSCHSCNANRGKGV